MALEKAASGIFKDNVEPTTITSVDAEGESCVVRHLIGREINVKVFVNSGFVHQRMFSLVRLEMFALSSLIKFEQVASEMSAALSLSKFEQVRLEMLTLGFDLMTIFANVAFLLGAFSRF